MQRAPPPPSFEETLANQYKEKLIELATQEDTYTIPIQDLDSGQKKIQDPSSIGKKKKYIIFYEDWEEDKEFKRHKITVADYQKSKELAAELEQLEDDDDEYDGLQKADKVMALYQFLAGCYLHMTPEEFQRADWGIVRIVLDACQFRTSHSLPDLSKALYEYFHFGKASLSLDEYEQVKMYRLWTGKAKTKPWEYNGGFVYEEDLNAILKMEELDISGKNYRAKKEAARGKVGADGDVHHKSTRYKNR